MNQKFISAVVLIITAILGMAFKSKLRKKGLKSEEEQEVRHDRDSYSERD